MALIFPDHRKSVVPNFPVRDQVVRPDEVAGVYVALRDELVDVDGAGGFQGDVFKLVLRHLNVSVGIDLVALHDVFVGNFLARGLAITVATVAAQAGLCGSIFVVTNNTDKGLRDYKFDWTSR